MKFLIGPVFDMSEIEKKVYKVCKWIPIGLIQYPCVKRTIYEIDIESLDELVEMCEDYSRGFSGVLIQEISSFRRKQLYEACIFTDAKFEIICYNSWIERGNMMTENSTEFSATLRNHFLNSFYGMTVTPKNGCCRVLCLKYIRPVGFIKQRKFIYADTDSIYIKQDEVTK